VLVAAPLLSCLVSNAFNPSIAYCAFTTSAKRKADTPYLFSSQRFRVASSSWPRHCRHMSRKRVKGVGAKVVTPEQMELSRLRAENIRLKRECEILKKATAYFARETL